MIRLLRSELYRLRHMLWVLPVLLLTQIAVIVFFEPYQYGEMRLFTPEQYRQLTRELTDGTLTLQEFYSLQEDLTEHNPFGDTASPELYYTDYFFAERELFDRVASDIEKTGEGYQAYLREVQDSAARLSGVSIFNQPGGYTVRSIQKTAEQYATLFPVETEWSEPSGARIAIDPEGFGWLGILGLLLFVLPLMTATRPAQNLLRSARLGRRPLLLTRLICMSIYTVAIATVLTLAGMIYGAVYYGLGDLSRPVQAVFQESPWMFSVGEAIIASWGLRCITMLSLALPIAVLFHSLPNMAACFGITAAAVGIGAVGYSVIPVYSSISFLKWINPYGFLNPSDLVLHYWCVNLFGRPVALPWVMFIAGIVFAFVSCGIAWMTVEKPPLLFKSRTKDNGKRKRHSTYIFPHELWRLLWGNKVAVVLLCFAAIMFLRCNYFPPRVYPDEAEYREVIETAVTLPEEERLDWVDEALPSASDWRANALTRTRERLLYLAHNPDGVLLYDTGWMYLFGLTEESRNAYAVCGILLLIGIILCVTPIREQEAIYLLRTAKRGHAPLTRQKILTAGMTGGVVSLLSLLPMLWHASRMFGLPNGAALSLPELAGIRLPLAVMGGIVFATGILLSLALCAAVYEISRHGTRVTLGLGAAASVICVLLLIVK
jgi:MFS family permease